MDWRTRLIAGVVFPLQERLKHHDTVRIRREMDASQFWPLPELDALRVSRLRALLQNIAVQVPYYRELFAHLGFDPASVGSVADLQRLPFLDKATIRANTEALKSAQAR